TDRTGHRAGGKNPLLVENAVVRQVDLETDRFDPSAAEQRVGVVKLAVLDPGRADQHGRTAIGGVVRKCLDRRPTGSLKRRLEYEVFRRIAGNEKLGKRHDIGAVAGRLRAALAGALQVAGNVADNRVKLRNGNGQAIGGAL